MANPSVVINTVQYASVPEVNIPKVGGGTAKFYFTGDSDASAENVLAGKKFAGVNGMDTGSMPENGALNGTIGTKNGTFTIPAGHTSGGSVALTNVTDCLPQNILAGKSILGQAGSLTMPTVSQDSTSKILSIS